MKIDRFTDAFSDPKVSHHSCCWCVCVLVSNPLLFHTIEAIIAQPLLLLYTVCTTSHHPPVFAHGAVLQPQELCMVLRNPELSAESWPDENFLLSSADPGPDRASSELRRQLPAQRPLIYIPALVCWMYNFFKSFRYTALLSSWPLIISYTSMNLISCAHSSVTAAASSTYFPVILQWIEKKNE